MRSYAMSTLTTNLIETVHVKILMIMQPVSMMCINSPTISHDPIPFMIIRKWVQVKSKRFISRMLVLVKEFNMRRRDKASSKEKKSHV
jgi:hypothetical protein